MSPGAPCEASHLGCDHHYTAGVYESLQEAAARWDVSVKTLRRRISEGALPAYRSGRLIRVKREDVDKLFHRIPTV